MAIASAVHDLKTLVLSFHPVVAVESAEEERVERVVEAVAQDLELPVYEWSLTRGLLRAPAAELESHRSTADPKALLAHLAGLKVDALFLLKDLSRHLEDPEVARLFRDVARGYSHRLATLVVTGARPKFPPEVEGQVVHLKLALPGPKELAEVVNSVLTSLQGRVPVRLELAAEERQALLQALGGLTINQARQAVARAILEDGALGPGDIRALIESKAQLLGDEGLLEYYPAEDNSFELGGFRRLTAWLERARVGFSDEAAALNLSPPRGVLLVGVQGCGKSLAAKWVARRWQMPLLKLDAGRLFNKYIGETERNVRRAIEVAESMAPAVLWIDELEKAFAGSRVGVDQDGGVSQRILATFLTWLQEKEKPVFVVATANDVFALPPELLRKGRFDEIFFVDLPDPDERAEILRIHLVERRQNPDLFDVPALVAASEGFSGAELEQAVIGALYGALHHKQILDTALLLEELGSTVPLSVSRREDLGRLRALASERFVPVN